MIILTNEFIIKLENGIYKWYKGIYDSKHGHLRFYLMTVLTWILQAYLSIYAMPIAIIVALIATAIFYAIIRADKRNRNNETT